MPIVFRLKIAIVINLIWSLFVISTVMSADNIAYPFEENIIVKVVYIIDGDSIMVKKERRNIEIRLWGIDAPEYDQPNAGLSKKALSSFVGQSKLVIKMKDIDKYDRLVVIAQRDGVNINEEMVKNGYAWVHVWYCRVTPCDRWFAMEEKAREKKIGIWQDDNPTPPWKWKAGRKLLMRGGN